MKAVILVLSVLISPAVLALDPAQIPVTPVTCESLKEKVKQDCDFYMCQDAVIEGVECVKDGDFFEGFVICMSEGLYYELDLYNKANPKAQLVCEDEE